MRDQVRRDLRRIAVDQADRAGRHAGVDEGADQLGRRGRRLLGRLDDDRAAGGERGRELAHDLVDREVPGREGGDRSDRLLDHELVDALRPRRDHAAIGAPPFLGEPVDGVGAVVDLRLGLGQGLALLHGHQRGDELDALAQQVGGLPHDLRALVGADPLPRLEALGGRLERFVEVLALGEGELADGVAAGRIDDGNRAAGARGTPLAVDEKLRVRVDACIHDVPEVGLRIDSRASNGPAPAQSALCTEDAWPGSASSAHRV